MHVPFGCVSLLAGALGIVMFGLRIIAGASTDTPAFHHVTSHFELLAASVAALTAG